MRLPCNSSLLIVFTLSLFLAPKISGQTPALLWERTVNQFSYDYVSRTYPTADGGYLLGATTGDTFTLVYRPWVFRTNSIGEILWSKNYSMSGVWSSGTADLVFHEEDESFLIAGSALAGGSSSNNNQILMIKADSLGETIWEIMIGEEEFREYAYAAEGTSDNGYILAGSKSPPYGGDSDMLVVKTDSLGNVEWQKTFGETEDDYAFSIHQTTEGGYIVGGVSWSSSSHSSVLIKLDSSGNAEWQQEITCYGGIDLAEIQQTTDEGYIGFFTKKHGSPSRSTSVIWFDDAGNSLYESSHPFTSAGSMIQTLDKGAIVTGEYNDNFWMARVDSLGNTVWETTIGPPYEGYLGGAICSNSDGGYLVTSEKFEETGVDYDVWMLCYESCTGLVEQNETDTVLLNVSPVPASLLEGINIQYTIPQSTQLILTVHDLSGRVVDEVENLYTEAGEHSLHWYPDNLSAGMYFVRLNTGMALTTAECLIVE